MQIWNQIIKQTQITKGEQNCRYILFWKFDKVPASVFLDFLKPILDKTVTWNNCNNILKAGFG